MRGVESGMLQEIGRYLSSEGFAIGGMLLLAMILNDDKALKRIEKHKLRRPMFYAVCIYFILIVIEVVRIGITYTS